MTARCDEVHSSLQSGGVCRRYLEGCSLCLSPSPYCVNRCLCNMYLIKCLDWTALIRM